MKKYKFSSIGKILQDAKRGKMFILVDDETRENEGDLVIPATKTNAKSINFGIIYGISAFGLSQNIGVSRTEAKQIIDEYFQQFPKVKH